MREYRAYRVRSDGGAGDKPNAARPPATERRGTFPVGRCLRVFKRLLRQSHLKPALEKAGHHYYDRLFTPAVTLWRMVFQRLNHDHTLLAAVADLHARGADLLGAALDAQAAEVWSGFRGGLWRGLRVLRLDGSQISLRPHPDIRSRLDASANKNGPLDWVLMRATATFRLHTGTVVASAADSTSGSEQALARRQIAGDRTGCLYLGDRNFGVPQMVQCVLQAKAHCLFRMAQTRAAGFAGKSGTPSSPATTPCRGARAGTPGRSRAARRRNGWPA